MKKDFYNRASQPQAGAAAMGLPLMERAAAEIPLSPGLSLADISCFHGLNSMAPIKSAIRVLRERNPEQRIEVTHTDLPTNDFSPVLGLINGPESYLVPGVYSSVRTGNFYQPIFAPGSQSLIWCSAATHWLSRVPGPATAMHAHLWQQQARQDWQTWIDCRAEELCPGGQVVMVGSGADQFGRTGAEGLVGMVRESLAEVFPPKQRAKIVMPTYHRTLWEWIAPLGPRLILKEVVEPPMPEPFWDELQQTGDLDTYVERIVAFAVAALRQPQLTGKKVGIPFQQKLAARVRANPELARARWWLTIMRMERV